MNSNDPPDPDVVAKKMRWFRNIKRQPFDAGNQSLDYSKTATRPEGKYYIFYGDRSSDKAGYALAFLLL